MSIMKGCLKWRFLVVISSQCNFSYPLFSPKERPDLTGTVDQLLNIEHRKVTWILYYGTV